MTHPDPPPTPQPVPLWYGWPKKLELVPVETWLVSGLDTLMYEWACTFDWRRKRKETGEGRAG